MSSSAATCAVMQIVAAADTGEAGVSIEGIAFVVDAMFGSQPVMNPFTGLEVPETVPISQQVGTPGVEFF